MATPSPGAVVSEHKVPDAAPEEAATPAPDRDRRGLAGPKAESTSPTVIAELAPADVKPFSLLGVTWASGVPDDATVKVRWRRDGAWSSWTDLDLDLENTDTEGGRPGTEPRWVGEDANAVAVRITSPTPADPQDLQIATVNPGNTPSLAPSAYHPSSAATVAAAASLPRPTIISRSAWGASPGGTCNAPKYGKTTLGAIIHHTAGTNSYTKAQSASIVRSTQAYHINSRDWCDIGYNFLVDKYGQIFEGRKGGIDKPVRGAHAGNGPVNEETMGVSMMGTFSTASPSPAMKNAVVDLVSWRFAGYKIPAEGTYQLGGLRLNRIAGHRNVVGTECPGQRVYDWLGASGGLRDRVATAISTSTVDAGNRLAGGDRYETAAKISRKAFPTATAVFVASGEQFPDGLSGGPAGAHAAAPMLLTRGDRLPATAAQEIQRLDPENIYVVGGEAAVSTPVVTALKKLGTGTVARLSGSDRYATAANTVARFWPGSTGTVYLAAGTAYPDALSGGASAGHGSDPLLLTRSTSLPAATKAQLQRLSPANIVLVGGTAVISNSVKSAVEKTVGGAHVLRLGGGDRYETAALLLKHSWSSSIKTLMVASGANFPDALAGIPASRAMGAALVISRKSCLPPSVAKAVGSRSSATDYMLGGASVLDSSVTSKTCVPPPPAPSSPNKVTVPSSRKIALAGHGYGHGIGMSQYGAQRAATKYNHSYGYILDYYYSGTTRSSSNFHVRALITGDTTAAVTVRAQSGLRLRNLTDNGTMSLPTQLNGKGVDYWRIVQRTSNSKQSVLQYKQQKWHTYRDTIWTGYGEFYGPATIGLVMPGGSVRYFRGALRSWPPSSGSSDRNTVNVVDSEQYVRGVIPAEMPTSWDEDALAAQAIAARTYAARSLTPSRYYDICDTTSCQVYRGAGVETSATNAATSKTSRVILKYQGKPAFAQFSSSSGGYTAQGSQPYLKAHEDKYDDASNPNHDWETTISASTLEKRYASIGTLRTLQIADRNGKGEDGGRVEKLKLSGSRGSVTISGNDARSILGLRSNWFRFR